MCDLLSHAPYSPDLAPSDFQIFLKVNTFGGKGFSKDTELQSCSYGFFLRILTDQTFERVRKEHRLWKSESETQFYPIPKFFDQQRKIVAVKLHGFATRGKTLERTLTRMERHHHQQNQFVTCLKNKDL
jgi:hypothetical protein